MPAGAGPHAVAAEAGHHPLAAVAQADLVVATQRQFGGRDLRQPGAGGVHLHPAQVAQHRVLAVAGGDAVAAQAAQHGVVAVAQGDLVASAGGGQHIGAGQAGGQAGGVVGEAGVVACHRMAAGTGGHQIGARACHHGLAAVAQHDVVGAAHVGIGRLQLGQHARRRPVDLAVVAQHGAGAGAATHGVAAGAAHDHLLAVAQRDLIGAAVGRAAAADLLQCCKAAEVAQHAAVAQHHAVALPADDQVVTRAGHHGVVAVAHAQAVVAAQRGLGRRHPAAHAGRIPLDPAVVAQHGVVAGARGDGVGADAGDGGVVAVTQGQAVACAGGGRGVGTGQAGQHAVGEADAAVVAQHGIGAAAGADRIGTEAADHQVAAAAQCDAVVAARAGFGGLHPAQHPGCGPVDLALVAQNGVGVVAGGDGVGTAAAHHHVASLAGADAVVAAGGGQVAGRGHHLAPLCQPGEVAQRAGIAQQQVGTAAGGDLVGTQAADGGVVAVAQLQQVVATQAGQAALGQLDHAGGGPGQRAVVAQHQVGAAASGQRVAATTGDGGIAAIAQAEGVVAGGGVGRVGAGQQRQHAGGVGGAAVVAQHHVIATAGGDGVAAGACQHGVFAAAQCQHVGAAQGQVGGLQLRQHARAGPVDLAVVAQHQVGPCAAADGVGTRPGQHGVGAVAGLDAVSAAAGVAIQHQAALELLQCGRAAEVSGLAAVAQQQVVAAAGGDGVGACAAHHQVVAVAHLDVVVAAQFGQGRVETGDEAVAVPQHAAVVAQHHIVASAGAHGVGAHAGQHQVVAGAGLQRVAAQAGARRCQVQRDGAAQPAGAGGGAAVGGGNQLRRRVQPGDVPASHQRAGHPHLAGADAGQAVQGGLQVGGGGRGRQRALLLAIAQLVGTGLVRQQQAGGATQQRGPGVVGQLHACGVGQAEQVDPQATGHRIRHADMAGADARQTFQRALHLPGGGVAVQHDRVGAVAQHIGAQRVGHRQHAALQRRHAGQHPQRRRLRRVGHHHLPLAAGTVDRRDLGMAGADAGKALQCRLDGLGAGVPGKQGAFLAVGQHVAAAGAHLQGEAALDAGGRAPVQAGVVAHQHVVVVLAGEAVVAEAAHQRVAAGAAQQGVVAALGEVGAGHLAQAGCALHRAGVDQLGLVAGEHQRHVAAQHARRVQQVVALVAMHHQQALGAAAGEVGHRHLVVAGIAVQGGDVLSAQAGDADHVGAGAGPDADAQAEAAAGGAVVDGGRRQAGQRRCAQHHGGVGRAAAEITDLQRVGAAAGVDHQGAAHGIQRVGHAGRRPHLADPEHVGARRAPHRGGRGGAGDGERVGARAQVQAQRFHAGVVDAVLPGGQHRAAGQGLGVDGLDGGRGLAALEGDDEAVAIGRPADGHVAGAGLAGVGVVRVQDRLQQRQQFLGRGAGIDGIGPQAQHLQADAADGAGAQAQRLHLVRQVGRGAAVAPRGDAHLHAGIQAGHQGVDRAGAAVPEQRRQVLPGQVAREGDGVDIAELVDLHAAGHAEQGVQRRRHGRRRDAHRQHHPALQGLGIGAAQHLTAHAQAELPADRSHLHHLLLGGRRHAQAAERAAGQQPGGVVGVGAVVHAQGVAAGAAMHPQQAGDLVHTVGRAGHHDAVVARAGIDQGVARHGLDQELVVAAATQDGGAAGMGGQHGEGVVAAAQLDAQCLQPQILDAALHGSAKDDRVGPHAQAGQPGAGQPAGVGGGAVGIADVQHIHLLGLVHAQVGVQRREEVVGAHCCRRAGRGPVGGEHHGVVAHRGVEAAGVVHLAGQAAQRVGQAFAGQRGVVDGHAVERDAVDPAALQQGKRHLHLDPGISAGPGAADAAGAQLQVSTEVGAAGDLQAAAAGGGSGKAGPHQVGQPVGHDIQRQAVGSVGAVGEVDAIERQRPVLQVGHRAGQLHGGAAVRPGAH